MSRATRPLRARLAVLLAVLMLGGVSAPPLRAAQAPPADGAFEPFWVQNHARAELWSGPDDAAISFGHVELFSYFKVLEPPQGPRLHVLNPLTEGTGWIDAAAVGPSGEPPEAYLRPPAPVAALDLPGRVVGGVNLRSRPEEAADSLIRNLPHNTPVRVLEEVAGADGEGWYRVGDGEFVHHSRVRLPRPFAPHPGRILAADLSEPVLVTAYEDGRAVYSALAIKGSGPWATPTGAFRIMRRVANETMDSATLGIPRGAPNGYYLQNVLNTQYFTADGASIHYNWWSGSFGYAGSHGCLGVDLADSQFFWDWADVGTPVFVHY